MFTGVSSGMLVVYGMPVVGKVGLWSLTSSIVIKTVVLLETLLEASVA